MYYFLNQSNKSYFNRDFYCIVLLLLLFILLIFICVSCSSKKEISGVYYQPGENPGVASEFNFKKNNVVMMKLGKKFAEGLNEEDAEENFLLSKMLKFGIQGYWGIDKEYNCLIISFKNTMLDSLEMIFEIKDSKTLVGKTGMEQGTFIKK